MSNNLSNAAQKVQDALHAAGMPYQVVELPQTTRTSQEAAQAVGCQVAQIVKSLVFKTKTSNKAILVLTSGANRVDETRLKELLGEPVEKPDADFVRQKTGFVIGGVPPLAHSEKLRTYIDEDLLSFDKIWAAGGTPFAVFQLESKDLQALTGGQVANIKKVQA